MPTATAPSILPVGLNRLDAERVASARYASRATNTRAAYRSQWKRFCAWCERRGTRSLPAAAECAAAYLTELDSLNERELYS